MKKSKFSEERRKAIIEEVSSGKRKLDDVCRDEQISAATFYKWKKELSDMQNDMKREVRRLELENGRLRKMYLDLQIDHTIVKEALEIAKKISAQRSRNA